jgi:hypothetical protein
MLGDRAVRYDGTVGGAQRVANRDRFVQDPTCRYFVGQIQAGGTGLDQLQLVCRYCVYYSNVHAYLDRDQTIGRLARTRGFETVNVVDLMAEGTVDEDIVRCMQSAQDVHETVLSRRIGAGKVGTPKATA